MDQLLLPFKFHGMDMLGIYFYIFASCEPLTHTLGIESNKLNGTTISIFLYLCW